MKRSALTILMAGLLTLLASACKPNQDNEPAAAAEGEAAAAQEQAAVALLAHRAHRQRPIARY
jgi:hypothetical protein